MNKFTKTLVIGSTGALLALAVAIPAFAAETPMTATTTPTPSTTTSPSMSGTTTPVMSNQMKVKKVVHHKKVVKKAVAKSMKSTKSAMMANPPKSTTPAN